MAYHDIMCLRELEKTQEQLLATTESGDLQRREDARARRLATAREASCPSHFTRQITKNASAFVALSEILTLNIYLFSKLGMFPF